MNTKHWAGVCILTVVAGLSVKVAASYLRRPDSAQVVVHNPTDALPFIPLPKSEAPKATPVARAIVREYVYEPIVTRPEPLETNETPATPLPTTGGLEETDVSAWTAPRPDRDARQMPYADEDDVCELVAVVVWLSAPLPSILPHSALLIGVPLPRQRVPDLSEESEEPPIADEALPSRFHPPHCPYGGHCPYPYR